MKLNPQKFLLLAVLLCLFPAIGCSAKQKQILPPVPEDKRLEGSVLAPEFPEDMDWLNINKGLSLRKLKGKIVLLDFWTYCCINCMHILPDLKKLEAKYPNELVVIGVHSAKFSNEKETESIRQAIMRYEITHPVINDREMVIWNQYAVSAWPTLILINPEGKMIGKQSGEDIFEAFDGLISETITYFDKKGRLERKPLKLSLEEAKRPQTLLSYPGKIRADRAKKLLFISDTNHNRILITDRDGKIQDILGNGRAGQTDGTFETAELNHPQGVYAEGDFLYIADTENHLVRAANFKTREVKTILGTGKKSQEANPQGTGRSVPLNSPWDLVVQKEKLYIAMAGSHQIYVMDLKTFAAKPYAGSGREARIDGPLLNAALAQPSGITRSDLRLFFADSEVSSIRSADLYSETEKKVETILGEDLFEFGDVDGESQSARLQHPLGIEFDEKQNQLYIADTYNSKIKTVDFFKKTSQTLAGTGKHGTQDGELHQAEFFEPGGLTLLDDSLFVADTNNHQIRVIDLKTRQVSSLVISGLEKASRNTVNPFKGRLVKMSRRTVAEGRAHVSLSFELPRGYHFNDEAPFHMEWKSGGKNIVFTSQSNLIDQKRFSVPIEMPMRTQLGKDELNFDAVVYYCRDSSQVCLFDHVRVQIPVEVKKTGTRHLKIKVNVIAKS